MLLRILLFGENEQNKSISEYVSLIWHNQGISLFLLYQLFNHNLYFN
jgi:hypothetical protein